MNVISPLTDPVDHCSSVFLLLSDGELRNSGVVVMTLRGGKEGIVDSIDPLATAFFNDPLSWLFGEKRYNCSIFSCYFCKIP
jgi:hypothetical protein